MNVYVRKQRGRENNTEEEKEKIQPIMRNYINGVVKMSLRGDDSTVSFSAQNPLKKFVRVKTNPSDF